MITLMITLMVKCFVKNNTDRKKLSCPKMWLSFLQPKMNVYVQTEQKNK